MHQIHVPKTLNVEAVERELTQLWKETSGVEHSDHEEAEEAMLRSRVVNLMIYLRSEGEFAAAREALAELSMRHPCRALVMLGERELPERDIEMYVAASCSSRKRSGPEQLCCEEVMLAARGHFVSELPSAAIPLLVPDLPVFLWWGAPLRPEEKVFKYLRAAANRLVIDSADFGNPALELAALAQLFNREGDEAISISDMNWARLTSWRALLANFYDVEDYRIELDQITDVRIDYVSHNTTATSLSAQAILMAGWLGSRLAWEMVSQTPAQVSPERLSFSLKKNNRPVKLELNQVRRPEMKPGRLARIALESANNQAVFVVSRSENGLHIETHATMGAKVQPGRVLPVRNRTTAQLLSREMEILSRDIVYEEALAFGINLLNSL
jgi:glucose-6-phosphate dehydrogenase assembly protein OpcA